MTKPALSGTAAEAGGTVQVYDGTTLLGSATVGTGKTWTFTPDTAHALANGAHSLTVKQVDVAGNVGSASSALALQVDTAAPILGTPVTGFSGGGYVALVFNEAVTLSANAKVSVYDSSHVKIADFLASDTSHWTYVYDNGVATGIRFDLGVSYGAMTLELASGTITDAAGNVALIGTPSFTVPHLAV